MTRLHYYDCALYLTATQPLIDTRFPAARTQLIPRSEHLFFFVCIKSDFPPGKHLVGKGPVHLNALAVVEQYVAQLLGHHVQVSLLALVGSGEHVEFGKVGGHVVERPGWKKREEIRAVERF